MTDQLIPGRQYVVIVPQGRQDSGDAKIIAQTFIDALGANGAIVKSVVITETTLVQFVDVTPAEVNAPMPDLPPLDWPKKAWGKDA